MMKLIGALALALMLVACGMSNEEIASTVRTSMQSKFDRDAQFKQYEFQVENVQVLKQTENQYQGIAKLRYSGETHDVPVQVTVDGKSVMWNSQPGAFMFVAQKEFQKLINPE